MQSALPLLAARFHGLRRLLPAVLAVFFLSGFSGLVYQVAWVKLLTHVFGVTTYAVSAVLAAFMGGLALGSYLGGRLADRWADTLGLYGLIEIGIGLYALFVAGLLAGLIPLYWLLYPALAPLGITGPEDILAGFGPADEALRREIGPGLVISDDGPYNEYFRLLRLGRLGQWLEAQ